jgi:hypothetical protein
MGLAMDSEERIHLLAERTCLRRQVAATPERARLTRISLKARLRKVEAALAALPTDGQDPGRTLENDARDGE